MTPMADRALRQASPKQSGVVLITGLIFMVILTMIVLAVLRSGSLEERMAANARNRQLAMQAAEAVLRDAEETLFTDPMPAPFDPYTPGSFSDVLLLGSSYKNTDIPDCIRPCLPGMMQNPLMVER